MNLVFITKTTVTGVEKYNNQQMIDIINAIMLMSPLLLFILTSCRPSMLIAISLFAWGFPLLMITVAAAFINKEHDAKLNIRSVNNLTNERHNNNSSNFHCW